MSRSILKPTIDKTKLSVRIDKGGCGDITPSEEAKKIGLVTTDLLNASSGVGVLDSNGLVPNSIVPTNIPSNYEPYVILPDYVVAGNFYTFTISNYDKNTTYNVSVDAGEVNLINDIIEFRAPLIAGLVNLTINGRVLTLIVQENVITKPSLTAPINLATNIPSYATITGSPFSLDGSMEIGILRASDAAPKDYYGVGVAISGNGLVMAVGDANKDTVTGINAGQVYIYDWDATTNTWIERNTLTASDAVPDDKYGSSVSLNNTGTVLVVGAFTKSTAAGYYAGQAYVYDWDTTTNTWVERNKLTASDAAATDQYGLAVSLDNSGTILAVGAYSKDTTVGLNAGQVYIYDWDTTTNTWVERNKLTASDAAIADRYGVSVSLSFDGSRLAVGAHTKDTAAGIDVGQVYIYDWNATTSTWVEHNKITASDAADVDQYGRQVALNGNGALLAITSRNKDTIKGIDTGLVYVYQLQPDGSGYKELYRLLPEDAQPNDHFGIGMDFTDDSSILAVSSTFKDTPVGIDAGQVHIYKPSFHVSSSWELATDPNFSNIVQSSTNDTTNLTSWNVYGLSPNTTYYARVKYNGSQFGSSSWSEPISFTTEQRFIADTEVGILRASDASGGDYYGSGVAISGDGQWLAVGAVNKNIIGKVYIYQKSGNGWTEVYTLIASDANANDLTEFFGQGLAFNYNGTRLVVGAWAKNLTYGDEGKVYVFDKVANSNTWTETTSWFSQASIFGGYFGRSVSLNDTGDILAVSEQVDTNRSQVGRVHIYDLDANTGIWTERSVILGTSYGSSAGDAFGSSVCLNGVGNVLAVGINYKNTGVGVHAGQVHIYDWNVTTSTWDRRLILEASDGATGDKFGSSVTLSSDGNLLIVGAMFKDTTAGADAGKVYIYEWNSATSTYDILYTLEASDAAAGDRFGLPVTLSSDGSILLVGSSTKNTPAGTNAGQVYTFK